MGPLFIYFFSFPDSIVIFVGHTNTDSLFVSLSSYTAALGVTVGVGCLLLILNMLIFAGIYYQRDRSRRKNRLGRRTSNEKSSSGSSLGSSEERNLNPGDSSGWLLYLETIVFIACTFYGIHRRLIYSLWIWFDFREILCEWIYFNHLQNNSGKGFPLHQGHIFIFSYWCP